MTKSFRPWRVDEARLLPPSAPEFVPEGHPAHLVRDTVAEGLDPSAVLSAYAEPRGYPPCHPAMMAALLPYACSRGVHSSRRIARACEERLDFQAVAALDRPDFRAIGEFRRRHLAALAGLFVQVLASCRRAGLVGLGHVAVDGTKPRANASKRKAMSCGRMGPAEAELAAEVAGWPARAEGTDAAEDAALGADRRGDEVPARMRGKRRRLARIRAAKAGLEAEARAAEAAKPDPGTKADGTPRGRRGRKPKHPPGAPKPEAQRNSADPESRIMRGRDGFVRAYDAQAAVGAEAQVILARHPSDSAAGQDALAPLLDAVAANAGARPAEVSADSGHCSEANPAALAGRGIRGCVATGRAKRPDGGEDRRRGPLVPAMRLRLGRAGRRSRYRLRKRVAGPVFGRIEGARGFRRFLLRGLERVKHEWALICAAHSLTKLAKAAAA